MADHLLLLWPRGVFWSIRTEFEFYFVLPLLVIPFAMTTSATLRKVMLGAMVAGYFGLEGWLLHQGSYNGFPHLPPHFVTFMPGIAIAFLQIMITDGQLPPLPKILAWALFPVALAGVVFIVPVAGANRVGGLITELYHILAHPGGSAGVFAILMFAVVFGGGLVQKAFSASWLRFIGIVSYSAYLLHIPIFVWVNGKLSSFWGQWAIAPISMAILIAAASMTYWFIERPCMKVSIR